MNEEKINQLKSELKQLVSDIISMGEEPPQFIQDLLLQVIEKVANQIQQLRQEGQNGGSEPPGPPIEPGMPSSNVEGFAYDDKTGKLFVRFLGKHPNRNGPVYAYDNVPPPMYELFRRGAVPARTDGHNKWGKWWKGKVPSMGASVYTLLKLGGFPYKKVA